MPLFYARGHFCTWTHSRSITCAMLSWVEQCSRCNAGSFPEKLMMRYLIWFLRIVLFLLLLGFAVRNVEPVTLYYYFGYEWTAPLVLVILFFFALGVMVGAASCLAIVFRQRRQLASYRKKYDVPDVHL